MGKKILGHSGGLDGWSSDGIFFPENNLCVIALENCSAVASISSPIALTRYLAAIILNAGKDQVNKDIPILSLTKETVTDYLGEFDYDGPIAIFRFKNKSFECRITGQPFLKLHQIRIDEFSWDEVDASVVFVRNNEGQVVAVNDFQNVVVIYADKLDRAFVEKDLAKYIGFYSYGQVGVLEIKVENEILKAKMTGQSWLKLIPVGENKFRWTMILASIEFVEDDTGKIISVVHIQNGMVFPVQKIAKH